MPPSEPACFLNLDVELKSSRDLAPLANHLDGDVFVLRCGMDGDAHVLCMEPESGLNPDIKTCTEYMLARMESLPEPLQALLDACMSIVFDYGFDGGLENLPLSVDLSPALLGRISALDASIRVTVYPYRTSAG